MAAQISVGPTVTELGRGSGTPGSDFIVRNTGAASVFVGGNTVTPTTGFELPAGTTAALVIDAGEAIYAVSAGAIVRIDVLRSS